jgi:hypothetical protein
VRATIRSVSFSHGPTVIAEDCDVAHEPDHIVAAALELVDAADAGSATAAVSAPAASATRKPFMVTVMVSPENSKGTRFPAAGDTTGNRG